MHAFKLFSYLILTSLVASLPSSTSDTLALDDTVPADGAADIVHGQCTFRATVRNFCDPNSHLPLWAISLQGIKNPNGNQIQGLTGPIGREALIIRNMKNSVSGANLGGTLSFGWPYNPRGNPDTIEFIFTNQRWLDSDTSKCSKGAMNGALGDCAVAQGRSVQREMDCHFSC